MTDAFDLGILARYRRTIAKAYSRFGKQAWLIIYQADVRFRLEHVEAMGIEIEIKHQRALKDNPELPPLTNKAKWTEAWRLALEGGEFWKGELDDLAQAVALKLADTKGVVKTDAEVASGSCENPASAGLDTQVWAAMSGEHHEPLKKKLRTEQHQPPGNHSR